MKNTVSIGNAGEYFVAGELERRGFTVAVPMSNVKDFDILAISRSNPKKQYAIQVKTTGESSKKWVLSKKAEDLIANNIIYVLVILNYLSVPEYHIVPSCVIAERLKREHSEWLSIPGKRGQSHHDNPMRVFRDSEDMYLNRWDYFHVD